MSDAPPPTCPNCGVKLYEVYMPVGGVDILMWAGDNIYSLFERKDYPEDVIKCAKCDAIVDDVLREVKIV
jgi:hypothetical protein